MHADAIDHRPPANMQIAACMTPNRAFIIEIENRATSRDRRPESRFAFAMIRAGATISITSEMIAANGRVSWLDLKHTEWESLVICVIDTANGLFPSLFHFLFSIAISPCITSINHCKTKKMAMTETRRHEQSRQTSNRQETYS